MDNYELTQAVNEQLDALSYAKLNMSYNDMERKLKELERSPSPEERLLDRIKARIAASAVKVSTVKSPHRYMKAVGTRELDRILEEEFNYSGGENVK